MSDVVRKARLALRAAIDRACIARGEAQWTSGYRSGSYAFGKREGADHDRLYAKEMQQFKECGKVEESVERMMRAYAKAVRDSVNRTRPRRRP